MMIIAILSDIAVFFITIAICIIIYYKWSFNYWKSKGVKQLSPTIPFGDGRELLLKKTSFPDYWANLYHIFKKKNVPYGGSYLLYRPILIATDLDLIKTILQRENVKFASRGTYNNHEIDPLTLNLFAVDGVKWREIRSKLTPTFTSGKMKMMFDTLADTAKNLTKIIDEAANGKEPLDVKTTMERYTLDVISSCAFGVEAKCLDEPNNAFQTFGKLVFVRSLWDSLKDILQFAVPHEYLRMFKMRIFRKDLYNFFKDVVGQTINYRETNNVIRKDFLQLLIKLKNQGNVSGDDDLDISVKESKNKITMDELIAQVFVFFAAGFETSSTVMTFALMELANHQDIQDKLREEIRKTIAKHDGKLTYECLSEMTYMDKVVNETLRKHPPLPFLVRESNSRFKIPNGDLVIEKGTQVFISILGIHRDPEYYPEPEKFDPERFNDENKSTRPTISFMPFGDGPRNCIGLRFGVMQSKVGLAYLLKDYKLTMNDKTVQPVVHAKNTIMLMHEHGVWLNVHHVP